VAAAGSPRPQYLAEGEIDVRRTLCLLGIGLSSLPAAAPASEVHVVASPAIGYASPVRLAHQRDPRANGRILLVFEPVARQGIPVYEAGPDGSGWRLVTRVRDMVNPSGEGWHLHWQPHLYEVPHDAPGLPAGTLLLAANSVRFDADGRLTGEQMQLYASTDVGRSWQYRGTIVTGGPPDGADSKGVWEPNLQLLDDGRLVAYYSSERHKADGFNQLLAHRVSSDGGRSWSAETYDVAIPGGAERPGMSITDRLPDGSYVMSYEDIDGPTNGQVYLKYSLDGLDWGDPADRGMPVETASGAWPIASPIVRWFPLGGSEGMLIVAAQRAGGEGDPGGRALYWNEFLGQGPWWEMPSPVPKRPGNIHAGWTQGLLLGLDGHSLIHITSSASADAPERADRNAMLAAAAPVAARRYEAENAARRGAAMIPDDAMSNGARVRIGTRTGTRLDFVVRGERAGPMALTVRYAPVAAGGHPGVSVNGAAISMPGERDAEGWRTATLALPLRAGANRITITAADGPIDLDYLELPL